AGTTADPQTITFTGRDKNGNPASLDSLAFTATGASPLLGRGKSVAGALQGVPPDLVLDVAHEGTTTTLDASSPVDDVQLGAADAPADVVYPALDGVRLRDRAGDPFVLGVRASKLTRLVTTFGPTTSVKAGSADGPLTVDGVTDTATGQLQAGA